METHWTFVYIDSNDGELMATSVTLRGGSLQAIDYAQERITPLAKAGSVIHIIRNEGMLFDHCTVRKEEG